MSHILTVDDDAVSLALLTHMLKGGGHSVVKAHGLLEAREVLSVEGVDAFDFVFSDYSMRHGNGLELLRDMRRHGVADRPAFVLLTGFAMGGEICDPRLEQVAAFLTKPVSCAELLRLVGENDVDVPVAA